ncbi:uncharacterized protein LOC126474339 [Schistocerca serialis cubense]|uniref:uncharacterized protein LOC126474339 n=1 Tax=Schistocerca serialis cubense TaxID=2023355 RepID=UPI00214E0C4B|nr:uncharacterized protein LOC126474339 [Schistocerca serialis cubense]
MPSVPKNIHIIEYQQVSYLAEFSSILGHSSSSTPQGSPHPDPKASRRIWIFAVLPKDVAKVLCRPNILFTNELKFTRGGVTNSHNHLVWSDENPLAVTERDQQHYFSINNLAGTFHRHGDFLSSTSQFSRFDYGDT